MKPSDFNAHEVLLNISDSAGWDEKSCLIIVCKYINELNLFDGKIGEHFRAFIQGELASESDLDDDETVFAAKPTSCRTCWRDEFLNHCSSDVNSRPATGWLCNNCGDFHLEKFKDLEKDE